MTMREEQERVQQAVAVSLSHLREDPWLTQRVLACVKGEKKMVKKLSVSVVLVIVLILMLAAAALAAGLGLFGELSQTENNDERLSDLEETAETVNVSVTTEDGITVEIGQAYYEGDRVFISYRLSGEIDSSQLNEGVPEGDLQWENFAAGQGERDLPEYQWLDGKGQKWVKLSSASLHDGLYLADGTYLEIIGGDNVTRKDGSVVGWKECIVPEELAGETVTFKAVLLCTRQIIFRDGGTFKRCIERGEETEIPFTLTHNENVVCLNGSTKTDEYQAKAELICGKIDMKGKVHVTGPDAWRAAWENFEEDTIDMIIDWRLYRDETPLCEYGTESIEFEEDNGIAFELLLPAQEELDGLKLVPVYSLSGEHAGEAVILEKDNR